MRKVQSQIKIGAMISYVTIFINIILGLIYTPWTLRVIGSSEYGLYTLTTSLISIFLLDFGMSAAVARFISNYRAEGKQEDINIFVGISVKLYALICALIFFALAIVFAFIDQIYAGLTIEELYKLKIVFVINALFIVLSFPVNICNGILTAYEEFVWLKLTDIVNKVGTVIITVAVLLLGGGLYALVFINGAFNFLAFIVKILIVKRKTPIKVVLNNKRDGALKGIFSFSAWTTVQSMSQQMITNLMPSVLGMTASTFAITIYGFARTIEGYVYTITQAINGLFMPTVSRIVIGENQASKVLPLMIKVGRINQIVINLLFIGFAVLGKEFVFLWVGAEYSVLYPCIIFLVSPYLIIASQQIAGTSAIVLNKVKEIALINLITSSVCLICSFFISKGFGVLGVCISICIGIFIKTLFINMFYYRVLKIDVFRFFYDCHAKLLPGFMVSIVSAYALNSGFSYLFNISYRWDFFFIKCLMVGMIYLVVMWMISWNDSEKNLLLSTAHKIARR